MLNNNLTASDDLQFKFATDGEGNYGFLGADGSLIPFKSGVNIELEYYNAVDSSYNYTHNINSDGIYIIGFITNTITSYSMNTSANILHEVNTVGSGERQCML